jgi:hypothetical protein
LLVFDRGDIEGMMAIIMKGDELKQPGAANVQVPQ